MSVLTLIRAKEEDSGNYTMRVENGDQSHTVGLILEVKGWHHLYLLYRYWSFSPERTVELRIAPALERNFEQ